MLTLLTVLLLSTLVACSDNDDTEHADGDEDAATDGDTDTATDGDEDSKTDGDEETEVCGGHGVVEGDHCRCDENYEPDPNDAMNCIESGSSCSFGPVLNGNSGWTYRDVSSQTGVLQLTSAFGFAMEGVGFAWTAELRNCTAESLGRTALSLRLLDAEGNELAAGEAVVLSAAPRRTSDYSQVALDVLGKEETGVAFFKRNMSSSEIAAIAEIEVTITTTPATDLEAAQAPRIHDVNVTTPYPGHWGLAGEVTNDTGRSLENLELFLFPRNDTGLLFGIMNPEVAPQTLAPDASGSFEETFGLVHASFTQYESFVSWSYGEEIDGDTDGDAEIDAEADVEPETDGDEELEPETEADAEPEMETDGDGDAELSSICTADVTLPAQCGVFRSATTSGSGDGIQGYSACTEATFGGEETVFSWTAPCETLVRAGATNIQDGTNVDLLVLDGVCDGASCLDLAAHPNESDYVWFVSEASREYFFVAEAVGSTGDFDLAVSCNCSSSYEVCDNGIDDDGQFGADCEDPKCAYLSRCAKSFADFTVPVICGDHFSGESNAEHGASNVVNDWCGQGSNVWTGPEMVYAFHFHASPPPPFPDKEVTVTIASDSDVDLIVLDSLDPPSCLTLAGATDGTGNETAVFTAAAFTPYYFVVDGRRGTIGDFDIQVTCDPE